MKILGVNIGWLSSAAILVDGKVVACVSEERFSRKKNDMSYPRRSIDFCLKAAGITGRDLDFVALASEDASPDEMRTRRYSHYSVEDWIREQWEYWYPRLYEDKQVNYLEVFKDKVHLSEDDPWDWSVFDFDIPGMNPPERRSQFAPMRADVLAEHLGLDRKKVVPVNHHYSHALYGYYAAPNRHQSALIFTIDAIGDDANATINVMENGKFTQIFKTDDCHMGRLFKCMTLLMGMKPHEDEYKLMGLAPYATDYHSDKPLEVFRQTMRVEGLGFEYEQRPQDLFFWFRERLASCRFDGIAGGLQRYLEEIMTQWIGNGIAETGIPRVILSGGVAMNVKAAMQVAALPEVEDLFVPASCGDESNAIGAAWALMHDHCHKSGVNPLEQIALLPDVYLGTEYSSDDIQAALSSFEGDSRYSIKRHVTPAAVAKNLVDGKVIGRFNGRMEFGARSLGNRSIIADPRRFETVKVINDKIKNRDFWMPFAPTVLEERSRDYMDNPKDLASPYMTLGFESTALAQSEIPAALHPADFTLRPQILAREHDPSYHELIKAFESLTGVGVLLNTSFNLHGEPIVESPRDAMDTFQRSGLDLLLLGDTLISKQNGQT